MATTVHDDDELVQELCRLYVDEEMSLVEISRRYGYTADWARLRISRAGVAIRDTTFKPETVPPALIAKMTRLYVDEGLTTTEIADHLGRNRSWVATQLEAAGVQLKPGGARQLDIDNDWIIEQYEEKQRSMLSISSELDVNSSVIKRVLRDSDITIRGRAAGNTRIDGGELRRLYLDERLTTTEIAHRLGMSTSGVGAAMHRYDIPVRVRGVDLSISRQQLQSHLDEGLTNSEIAAMHDVAVFAVTRRLRAERMRRPPRAPTTRPTPPRITLSNLYVDQQMSLADIATQYEVPHATVRRWLDKNSIERRPRTYTTNPTTGHDLDHDTIANLYVTEEWTAAEIGRHVGVTKKIILDHLHRHGVPLRPSGAKRPATDGALLDRLYADHDVVNALEHHDVPLRPTPGALRERFPDPAPITPSIVARLYTDLGLSISQISLVTGHLDVGVRAALQQAGIATRDSTTRSPWTLRHSDLS